MIIDRFIDENGPYLAVQTTERTMYAECGTFYIDEDDGWALAGKSWKIAGIGRAQYKSNLYVIRSAWPRCNGTESLHRVLMSHPEGLTVDHIDGNGLNCRRYNLRVCTKQQNRMNVRRYPLVSRSGVSGVYPTENGRWYAQIRCDTKIYYLGRFDTKEEASAARDRMAAAKRGQFAVLNT